MAAPRLVGRLLAACAVLSGSPGMAATEAAPAPKVVRPSPKPRPAPGVAPRVAPHAPAPVQRPPTRPLPVPPRAVGTRAPPTPRRYSAPAENGAASFGDRPAADRRSFDGVAPGGVYSNRVYGFHGGTFAAIRARPYVYPHGYAYRPFYAGQRFPAFLLLSAYFILNWNLYNLTPPPDPALVWVRFGPDALLVNTYTGQVLDVAPRIFDEGEPPPSGYAPQAFSDGPAPPPPGAADQYEGPAPQSPAARDPQTDSDGTPYPGPTGYREPPPPIAVPQG